MSTNGVGVQSSDKNQSENHLNLGLSYLPYVEGPHGVHRDC